MIYQNENIGGSYELRCRWHDRFYMDHHLHEYTELAFVQKGTATVWVQNNCYTVHAGEMIFILPNQSHAYWMDPPSELICAVFSNDFIPLFFRKLGQQTLRDPVIAFADRSQWFQDLPHMTAAEELHVMGVLNMICARVLEQGNPVPVEKQDGALYYKAINYITANYNTPMTLESMARALGYNTKYLSTSLHRLTGMHFKKILSFYRVDYARHLLRQNPEMKITDVAYNCGFSSVNTFNREFKTIVGATPRAYRTNGRTTNG